MQVFSHVQLGAARDICRPLRRKATTGDRRLYVVINPKGKGYVYAVPETTEAITDLVVVSKPVATKTLARKDSKRRFGVQAREIKIIGRLAYDQADARRMQKNEVLRLEMERKAAA
jgi:hypothetical protein